MTTKTVATEPKTPAELVAEYNRLALAVSTGDAIAAIKLEKVEAKIEAEARAARRAAGAAEEAERIAAAAAAQAEVDARAARERLHAKFLQQREAAFKEIQDTTAELARAVELALRVDREIWAAALACGYSPETRTSSRITNYIGWQLGSMGAGLTDMPTPMHSALRKPLTTPVSKES